MGLDCDYERGTDEIVNTAEELTRLRLRERNELHCDYDRGTGGIVNTREERTKL
jgi:hypothetical protein